MATKSIVTGLVLIVLGVVVTAASDSNSATSLIPAFVGAVFVILGVAGRRKPDLNHHFMHGTAMLSLLAILGSLGSLIGRSGSAWAVFSQIATSVISAFFLVLAIQSFKEARAARQLEDA